MTCCFTSSASSVRLEAGIVIQPGGPISADISDLGAIWVRRGLRWIAAENVQGSYLWPAHDASVNGLEARGVRILGVLSNGPVWACGPNPLAYPSGNTQSYFDYCSAVATRYAGRVAAYEIWNEPNGSWNGPWTADQYRQVLLGAAAVIHAADPAALVVGGVMAGVPIEFQAWTAAVLTADVIAATDVWSVHLYCRPFDPYVGDTRGPVPERLANSATILSGLGWTKPVWSTEGGWPTIGQVPGKVTEAEQADYTVKLAQICRDRGMLQFPFQLYGSGTDANTDEAGGMGLIRPDGTRKPAFDAYRNWIFQQPETTRVPTQIYAINVKDYGALGDGSHDDTSAFTSAITAAASNAYRAVYVPPGTYKITGTLTLTDVEMFGLGHPGKTILYWPTNLGSNTYAIKLRSTTSEFESPLILRNLKLNGPQIRPTSQIMNAVQICNYSADSSLRGKARFYEVHVTGFWFGFDCDTIDGHIFWDRCQISNNHDGIYFRTPGHDYHLDQCGLEGNTRSGLTGKFDCPIHRLSMMRCHIGQQPFGIYKEAGTTTAEFLSSARIYATSFEQIGNGVLYSDATSSGEGDKLQDIYLDISAFSWAPATAPQYDAAYNRDAAIRCSQISRGVVEIWQDLNPFSPGDTGSNLAVVKLSGYSSGALIYNFRGTLSHSSSWLLLYAGGAGNITKRNVVNSPDGERSNTLTVLSGQTSAVLSMQMNRYVCHIDAFRAHAQAKDSDIGTRQYWVTHAQNGNNVDVTITLSSAAGADTDFNVFVVPCVS